MRLVKFILLLACFGIGLVWASEGEEKENGGKPSDQPSIHLFADPNTTGKGLVVEVQEVKWQGDKPAKVCYWITNYLEEEEVFVEVRDGEELAYDFHGPNEQFGFAGGGGFPGFPDNIALLKRLHASSYRGGRRITCGCAIARVEATADLPEDALTKGKTTVSVHVRGFYRTNGKEFSESIDVPLQLKSRVAR